MSALKFLVHISLSLSKFGKRLSLSISLTGSFSTVALETMDLLKSVFFYVVHFPLVFYSQEIHFSVNQKSIFLKLSIFINASTVFIVKVMMTF